MTDKVNNPPHYTRHPSGIECIDVTEHMNFNLGNAIKYIWRAGLKDEAITDLRKAQWYIDREIRRLRMDARPERTPDRDYDKWAYGVGVNGIDNVRVGVGADEDAERTQATSASKQTTDVRVGTVLHGQEISSGESQATPAQCTQQAKYTNATLPVDHKDIFLYASGVKTK